MFTDLTRNSLDTHPGFPILLSPNNKIVMIKCKINVIGTVKNDRESNLK